MATNGHSFGPDPLRPDSDRANEGHDADDAPLRLVGDENDDRVPLPMIEPVDSPSTRATGVPAADGHAIPGNQGETRNDLAGAPSASAIGHDPAGRRLSRSATDLTDTAWFALAVRCAACGTELPTGDIAGMRQGDPLRWARVAGHRAADAGWTTATDEPFLFCPDCTSGASPAAETAPPLSGTDAAEPSPADSASSADDNRAEPPPDANR